MTTATDDRQTGQERWASSVLPWLLGGVPFVVAAMRVLLIARGDPISATAVLIYGEPLKLVLGSMITVLPIIVMVGGALMWLWAARVEEHQRTAKFVAAFATFVILPYLPFYYIFIGVPAFVPLLWMRRSRSRDHGPVDAHRPDPDRAHVSGYLGAIMETRSHRVSAMLAFALMLLVMSNAFPPLPPEIVTHRAESVGYVLSADSDWVVLLRMAEPAVDVIPAEDVGTRTPCRPGFTTLRIRGLDVLTRSLSSFGRSPSGRWGVVAEYPPCPS